MPESQQLWGKAYHAKLNNDHLCLPKGGKSLCEFFLVKFFVSIIVHLSKDDSQ
jgi:hypothetical protein